MNKSRITYIRSPDGSRKIYFDARFGTYLKAID